MKMKGRNKKGQFTNGNKVAEKWTVKTVTDMLSDMWKSLTTDEDGETPKDKNFVRANDIKLIQEICLMYDIDPDTWVYWNTKFANEDAVFRLIKKIKWVLEARMIYSGQTMDIFVMKNHYGYTDKKELEHSGEMTILKVGYGDTDEED